MSDRNGLPVGWARATIGDLVAGDGLFCDGDWVESKDQDPSGGVRLTQLADIGDGAFLDKSRRFMTPESAARLNCTYLQTADVLIARMPDPLGRACVFPGDTKPCVTAVDVCMVRPGTAQISPRWLMWFVNCPDFRARVASLQSGSTRKRISRRNLATIEFPVPPSSEQRRIVEKIEELFSRLDAGVAALERVRANLKRYRAAVLKAAVEGRLTEQWRAEHPDAEPASVLLERILRERRRKWEEDQLARFAEKGTKPPKNWQAKYKEPQPPDTTDLPDLPEGWVWAQYGSLVSFVTSGSRGWARHYATSGSSFIRIGNLDHASISLDMGDVQHILPPDTQEAVRTRVQPGDILVSITADIGMIGLVPHGIPDAYINQHISLTRPVGPLCRPFVAWYLATEHGGQRQYRELQRGATKVGLGLDDIRSVVVPLPPAAEQAEIVAEVERRLSVLDEIERETEAALKRAARLRQSILKRAFEGRLVPQDPNDEPASVLLERIKAQRAAVAPSARRSRKGYNKEEQRSTSNATADSTNGGEPRDPGSQA